LGLPALAGLAPDWRALDGVPLRGVPCGRVDVVKGEAELLLPPLDEERALDADDAGDEDELDAREVGVPLEDIECYYW